MPLSETQSQTLYAAMGRIIPADDTPGAVESGAMDYLLGQFTRDLRGEVSTYQTGLDAINREAVACYTVPFAHLTPAQQDELLTNIEQGIVQADWPINAGKFFSMLVNHTAEGFYSDPANGGNRDAVSWEMLGF